MRKSLLIIAAMATGMACAANYESEIKEDSVKITKNAMSTSTDNKATSFPIGHVIIGWVGTGYVQENVNKTTKVYIVNDNEGYPRYASDWYGSHNSGVYLEGDWQYRGYVWALAGVDTGLLVRVK